MPIDPSKIKWDDEGDSTKSPKSVSWDTSKPLRYTKEMVGTLSNVGKLYPAFEVAANIATSSYGVPISGLVGLATLPFGVEAANSAIEAVQKFLVYQPQTEGGQQLNQAATYPFQKLSEGAGAVASLSDDPKVQTAIHTAIESAPALVGMRKMMPPKIGVDTVPIVEHGINKGIRPSIVKKEMWGQRQKYMRNAEIAVDEIIKNKDNLKLIDRDGNVKRGLPESLNEFSQAIEQTKRDIFLQYDELSKTADTRGAAVNMAPIVSELDGVANNRVLQTMSPETIAYAEMRKKSLDGKSFTTQEAQQMVAILNQSEKAFYANPTPELKGKAYVDGLIANNMRAGLDAAIEGATGIEYQPLKHRYGALRMLEADVTKRSIVDARKNIKGLVDFSDIFSSSQLIQGLVAQQPALVASGAVVKGMQQWIKRINDPNRTIKNMFQKVEQSYQIGGKQVRLESFKDLPPETVYGSIAGQNE